MMRKTASIKPTKVTLEDIELADEISLVTTIKVAISNFSIVFSNEFQAMEEASATGNPVAAYKQIISSHDFLTYALNTLQANLLVVLGDIEPEDANELSDPAVVATAGTMDAALTDESALKFFEPDIKEESNEPVLRTVVINPPEEN